MSLVLLDQSEYKRLDAKAYDREKRKLRIELLKLQEDVIKNNRKICIVFEGRDTAGKSTAIKFFSEYLTYENNYKFLCIIILVITTFVMYILISIFTKAFKLSDIKIKY